MNPAIKNDAKTWLSVIVPTYNVEDFVDACLDSALRQSRAHEIEILVVDDGSTDSTLDRVLAIQRTERGSGIKVFRQENGGPGAARNAGIARASSPYIGFLDADDVWADNFSDVVMPLLEAGNADIVEFNVSIIDTEGRNIDTMELVGSASLGARECGIPALMEFVRVCQVFSAARVYRRELWDGIRFPAGRLYEDCATIPRVYTRARTLHGLSEPLYAYRRRAGSITQIATPRTVTSLTTTADEALANCDGGDKDAYWIALFHKVFSIACFQAARVDARAFPESMALLEAAAERYRVFALERQDADAPLRFHMKTYANRRVYQMKRVIKRMLGRELRSPAAPRRPVVAEGAAERLPAGDQ
jgi:glycosyltransferase involved in cell wall biosynthesis